MRLVLDTNVVASALLWDGPPRRLLHAGRGEGLMLFTSLPLLQELADVLARQKFEKKIALRFCLSTNLLSFTQSWSR
jgi:uncharacterized protein